MDLTEEIVGKMGSHQLCDALVKTIKKQKIHGLYGGESKLVEENRDQDILATEIERRLRAGRAAMEELAKLKIMPEDERERLKWETLRI